MKKCIMLLCFLAAIGCVDAQELGAGAASKSSHQSRFGVKAGLNIATLTGDVEDVTSKAGIHAGLFAEFGFADKFSFQPEVLYSMQGGKSTGTIVVDGVLYDVKENLKLNYLNIPLLIKFRPQPKLGFIAGPQLGLLLSAKDKISFTDGFQSGSETVDVKEELKSFDFSAVFGIGYDFTNEFFAEARYAIGISNINDADDTKMHNGVFQISLGYQFN